MDKIIGNFEWGALCMPTLPWGTSTRKMPFFGRNDETPILVAAVMGLQHAFAMLGGESIMEEKQKREFSLRSHSPLPSFASGTIFFVSSKPLLRLHIETVSKLSTRVPVVGKENQIAKNV